MPGSITSSRISAGRCFATASRAWSPRLQEATSNSSLLNTSSRPSRMWGSSSTMRILLFMSLTSLTSGVGLPVALQKDRQTQTETTAAAVARFVAHIAAMSAGDLTGEGEAQPRALNPTAQAIVRAIKLFKNLLRAALRDAEAAIEDF